MFFYLVGFIWEKKLAISKLLVLANIALVSLEKNS